MNIFDPVLDVGNVGQPDRSAVLVGDDQVTILIGAENLIVVANRPRIRGVAKFALGSVGVCLVERGADGVQTHAQLVQKHGIDFGADSWFGAAAVKDLPDAIYLGQFLGENRVRGVVDFGERDGVGAECQDQDGRIRRVDLAIGRIAGKVGGQLAARRIDGGLHVASGGIDVAAEVELENDV